MNREWAIPVALGLVAAAGLWALPDGDDATGDGPGPTGTGSSSTGPSPFFSFPFGESRGEAGEETSWLRPRRCAPSVAFGATSHPGEET